MRVWVFAPLCTAGTPAPGGEDEGRAIDKVGDLRVGLLLQFKPSEAPPETHP